MNIQPNVAKLTTTSTTTTTTKTTVKLLSATIEKCMNIFKIKEILKFIIITHTFSNSNVSNILQKKQIEQQHQQKQMQMQMQNQKEMTFNMKKNWYTSNRSNKNKNSNNNSNNHTSNIILYQTTNNQHDNGMCHILILNEDQFQQIIPWSNGNTKPPTSASVVNTNLATISIAKDIKLLTKATVWEDQQLQIYGAYWALAERLLIVIYYIYLNLYRHRKSFRRKSSQILTTPQLILVA